MSNFDIFENQKKQDIFDATIHSPLTDLNAVLNSGFGITVY